jgi:CspA family cold shock protein
VSKGRIKGLVKDRGFGFIAPEEGGNDVFFHSTSMTPGMFESLQMDQELEFDVEPDPRDPRRKRAVNVKISGA